MPESASRRNLKAYIIQCILEFPGSGRKGNGGEGGIRTHGALAGTPHFECGTIDHSATSPGRNLSEGFFSRNALRRYRSHYFPEQPAARSG